MQRHTDKAITYSPSEKKIGPGARVDFPNISPEDLFPKQPSDFAVGEPYEMVNHPKHYNEHPAGIECIDVIEHMSLNIGTAIKYLWRAGLKPGNSSEQDLKKALWYIEREISRVKKHT